MRLRASHVVHSPLSLLTISFVLELIKAGCRVGEGLAMGGSGLQANLRAQTNRQHLKSIWRVLFPALRLSLGRDMVGPAIFCWLTIHWNCSINRTFQIETFILTTLVNNWSNDYVFLSLCLEMQVSQIIQFVKELGRKSEKL